MLTFLSLVSLRMQQEQQQARKGRGSTGWSAGKQALLIDDFGRLALQRLAEQQQREMPTFK
jgi:hypothetical protein